MSKNKNVNKDKIENLKKELEEFSKKSPIENEEILNRNLYKQTLVRNFRNIVVINTLLVIILLVFLYFYTGENVLKYDSEDFKGFYIVFLMIVFDLGLSFLLSSFSRKVKSVYKNKSFFIGIKIFFLILCLGILFFINTYSFNKIDNGKVSTYDINGVEIIEFE